MKQLDRVVWYLETLADLKKVRQLTIKNLAQAWTMAEFRSNGHHVRVLKTGYIVSIRKTDPA